MFVKEEQHQYCSVGLLGIWECCGHWNTVAKPYHHEAKAARNPTLVHLFVIAEVEMVWRAGFVFR